MDENRSLCTQDSAGGGREVAKPQLEAETRQMSWRASISPQDHASKVLQRLPGGLLVHCRDIAFLEEYLGMLMNSRGHVY